MKSVSNMSNTDRQRRIKQLLSDALELEPAARDAFVRGAAMDDATLVDEVRVLIHAHERASHFILDPTISGLDACGETIGAYTLIRRVGEGGFGSVYLAQQREPIARQVALKIIKPGMDTQQVIARFEAERQVLAMMKHPGIAAVFDAGTTSERRPYFVMEFVDGVAITSCCDQQHLSVEDRLNLFMQVCSAVQHAHTKGVIHRDLKPSNLLVTVNDGVLQPKVIDFGIAKATSGRLTDVTISTEGGRFFGTPQYMSPEQADENATDIDTRADVYSLGVVLYEMLAGVSPFEEQRSRLPGIGEWRRIIREDEPPKPSTRLSSLDTLVDVAAQRGIEPKKLAARVRGDLDWITLKAMEKDRQRRYGSAAELAEDIRRHLHHEPVIANPPSRFYRAKKFVRRHRLGVLTSCLIGFALASGAAGLAVGMAQAQQSATEARDAAQQAQAVNAFMHGVLTSVDPDVDGADVRLMDVLQSASDSASERFSGHPQLEAQVCSMLGEVYSHLSMWNEAARERQRAEALWRSAVGEDDVHLLDAQLQYVVALLHCRRLHEVDKVLADLAPRAMRVLGPHHDLTLLVDRASGLRINSVQYQEGERALRAVYEHAQQVGASENVQISCLHALVEALDSYVESGADEAALVDLEAFASEFVERSSARLGPTSRTTMNARLSLVRSLHARGDYAAVAAACDQVLEQTANRFTDCHNVRVAARVMLSEALYRLGQKTQAADLALQALDCSRDNDLLTLGTRIQNSLPMLEQGGQWSRGEALSRELGEILAWMGGHEAAADGTVSDVASFVSRQGRLDEADALFTPLLARQEELHPTTLARLERRHGEHLTRKGAFAEAEQHLSRATELVGDVRRGTWYEVPDDIISAFIILYDTWGKPEKAAEYRRLQLESLAARPGAPWP